MLEMAPAPYKIVQTAGVTFMLYERDTTYRQVYTDGRKLPDDPQPSWLGYSVGKWDGDSLVVDTIGFNDRGWLDARAHTHSEALHLTERFHRIDFGHMEIEETFSDPAVYSRPLTATVKATLIPDTELLEYVCAENEKDRGDQRLIGTASEELKAVTPVKVAPGLLAQYVGSYDFRFPENPTVSSVWPVTMADGQLFLHGAPLIPLSETQFVWASGNRLEFFKDAQGRVTHFEVVYVEGNLVGRRISDRK